MIDARQLWSGESYRDEHLRSANTLNTLRTLGVSDPMPGFGSLLMHTEVAPR